MEVHDEEFMEKLYEWQEDPDKLQADVRNTIEVHVGTKCAKCNHALLDNARFVGAMRASIKHERRYQYRQN